MSSRDIRAGKAHVEIGAKDKLTAALKRMQAKLRAFGAGVRQMGTALAAGSAAVGGALFAVTKNFATAGAALDDMSKRTGASVEALSELSFAAGQSGSSLEDVEIGLKKMQKTIADAAGGSKSAAEALAALGLSAEQLAGLSPDEQMLRIADGLNSIEDPAKKTAAALSVFGKSGTKLLPMLEGGAAGLGALRQEARDAGVVMSTEMAQSAAVLDDGFDKLWRTVGGLANQVGAALAPALTQIVAAITPIVAAAGQWISENAGLVVAVGVATVAVGALGVALVATGAAISAVAAIIGVLTSPITLAVAAIGGLVAWFLTATDAGQRLGAIFGETFKGITDALGSGNWELAARIGWSGIVAAFYDLILPLREYWTDFIFGIQAMWHSLGEKLGTSKAGRVDQVVRDRHAAIAALRKQAVDARKELQALRDEAARPVPAPGGAGQELRPGRTQADYGFGPGGGGLVSVSTKQMADAVLRASSVGTFSAAGAARLGGGGLAEDAQRANIEAVKVLKKIDKRLADNPGQPIFV